MMFPQDIPADILAFLSHRIDTVPELETLLLMSAGGGQPWTSDDVVARSYTSPVVARAVLDALQRRGFITADAHGQGFRFHPHDPADVALVARVGAYYRANLVRVATLIHDRGPAAIREFARAFDFKKDH
jgi:hypothetical protein